MLYLLDCLNCLPTHNYLDSIQSLEGRVSIQENTLTPFINKHDEQMDALVEKDDCLDEDIKILGDSMRQFEDDVKRGLAGLVMQSKTDMEQQSQYMRSVFNTLQTEINVARQDAARMLAFQDEFQSVVDRLNTVMIDCQHNNEDMEIVRDRVRVVEGNLRETSRNLEVSTEHVNVLLRDKESAIRSWTIDRLTELQSRLSHAARALPAPSEAPTLASTKAVDIQPPQSSAALDPLIEDARNKELSEMKRAMAKLAADLTKVNDEVFIFARRQDERTQGKVADIKEELVTIASKLDIAYDKAEEAILSIEAIRKAMEEAVPGSTTRGNFLIGAQDLNERPIPPNPESAEHSPNVSSAGRSEARAINTSNDPIIKTIMTATNQHAAILSRMETDISKLQSEFLKEISTRNRTISLSQESLKAFEDALDEEIRNRRINYQEVMRIIEGLIGPDEMQKAVLQSSSNHPINLQFSEMGSRPLRRPGSGHAISPSNLPAATSSTSISEIAPDSHIGISLLQTQTSGNRTGDLENMNDSPLLFPAVELPGSHSQASISASGSASAFAPLSASNSASISAAASAKGPSPPLVLPAVNTPRKVTFQNPASEGLAEAKSIADTKLSSVAMADARSAETERWKVRHNASIPIPTALPESSTTANRDRPSTANTGQTAPSPRKARVEKEATTQLKTARSTPSPASIDPRPPTAPQSRR
eukprot:TRINITY_DN4428_c0_g1_i4.p1 TRINITY_DN4428_c0_g1~~TRINITY_DN4428_c0_g1_i4.p1  ORF type:complete len:706 (+),score=148.54 TRINITY_DN4428_c0_g1_i4:60-2177(+)